MTRKGGGSGRGALMEHAWRLAVLLLVCALLFAAGLSLRGLWEPGEAARAEAARQVLLTGQWAAPRLAAGRYLPSAPLSTWSAAVGMALLGVGEAGARLPAALWATLAVAALYLLGCAWGERRDAFWSALILATSAGFIVQARTPFPAPALALATLLGFWGLWRLTLRRPAGRYLFWSGAGLAFFAQGPLALVLLPAAGAAYALLERRRGLLGELFHWRGPAFCLAPCLAWLAWVAIFDTGYLAGLFSAASGWSALWHPLLCLAAFFPWLVFLPWSLREGGELRTRRPARGRSPRPGPLLLVWLAAFVLVPMLPGCDSPQYLAAALAPLALWLGPWLAGSFSPADQDRREARRRALTALALLALLLGAAVLSLPAWAPGLTWQDASLFLLWGPGLLAGLALGSYRWRRRPGMTAAAPLVLLAVCLAGGGLWALRADPYYSLRPLLASRQGLLRADYRLVNYGRYFAGSAFYSRRPVELVPGFAARRLVREMAHPRRKVAVVASRRDYLYLDRLAHGTPGLLLFEWAHAGDKVLFANRPRPR